MSGVDFLWEHFETYQISSLFKSGTPSKYDGWVQGILLNMHLLSVVNQLSFRHPPPPPPHPTCEARKPLVERSPASLLVKDRSSRQAIRSSHKASPALNGGQQEAAYRWQHRQLPSPPSLAATGDNVRCTWTGDIEGNLGGNQLISPWGNEGMSGQGWFLSVAPS